MYNTNTQKKEQPSNSRPSGRFSSRLWNALPYTRTAQDLYAKTKQSNILLKAGFNLAESAATTVASPFLSKYEKLDTFAGSQLEKLEEMYGEDLIAKSVGAVAYPIGYTYGLASYARTKVFALAKPTLELSYEWADVVVDNLMPPDSDETQEEEYRHMSSLQQKSPFRRIADRTTMNSVLHIPPNALYLSINLFSSSLYMSAGFAQMSMDRLLRSASTLVNSINTHFEEDLKRTWSVKPGDISLLYRATLFHGTKYVNDLIEDIESRATELSQYLNDHKLPYNSAVVQYVADQLKGIERSLVRTGGILVEPEEEQIVFRPYSNSSASSTRKIMKPRPTISAAPVPKARSTPDRVPSIMTGEAFAVDVPVGPELAHKAELDKRRMPSVIWGADNAKEVAIEFTPEEEEILKDTRFTKETAKKSAPAKIQASIKPKHMSKHVSISKRKAEFMKHKEGGKSKALVVSDQQPKAEATVLPTQETESTEKAVIVSDQQPKAEATVLPTTTQQEVTVLPTQETTLTLNETAAPTESTDKAVIVSDQQPKAEALPTQEVVKPVEEFPQLNLKTKSKGRKQKKSSKPSEPSYVEIATKAAETIPEPVKPEEPIQKIVPSAPHTQHIEGMIPIEQAQEPEAEIQADEFGFELAKPKAHDHLIPNSIAKELAHKLIKGHKHVPETPVNSPAEIMLNNPYSEILVDEKLLRGPGFVESKSKDELVKLHKQAMHELLREVGIRLTQSEEIALPELDVSKAQEESDPSWEVPKHPAHVHVEVEEAPAVLPVSENNPFGKLAEVDASEDPFTMGASAM